MLSAHQERKLLTEANLVICFRGRGKLNCWTGGYFNMLVPVLGSPQSLGFNHRKPIMSLPNLMVIHPAVV